MQKFNSFDIYTQNTTLDERQQFVNLLTDCCFKSKPLNADLKMQPEKI